MVRSSARRTRWTPIVTRPRRPPRPVRSRPFPPSRQPATHGTRPRRRRQADLDGDRLAVADVTDLTAGGVAEYGFTGNYQRVNGLGDAVVSEDLGLVTPVELGLSTWDDAERRGGVAGSARCLRTVLRSSPASRAISDKPIATDSNKPRNHRSSDQRRGSKTTADHPLPQCSRIPLAAAAVIAAAASVGVACDEQGGGGRGFEVSALQVRLPCCGFASRARCCL
jgi:hypothetical protein